MTTQQSNFTIVTVTEDSHVEDHGSIVWITGTGSEGQPITFAADHRPAALIIEAVLAEGEIPAAVEGWQIVREGF